MKVILELIRILAISFILGSIMSAMMTIIYRLFSVDITNTNGVFLVGIAIFILLFVLYRNKLQFSGFYDGEGKIKLSKKVSCSLISLSVFLFIMAPFIQ
ncbi:hypothetical protein [Lysinibacillus halotolerans]|uniref:Uncharacterized protein n=1 Tax=Lysinibacillus halotolerans TaxID=1368476 RepID=A0A3M8HEK1_9BACI|nr:hypothetical protein [Lysinibacillus halotolerans]RND00793.1 hypothetical protein EC501_03720 [Lysinibacillus halotolerans]